MTRPPSETLKGEKSKKERAPLVVTHVYPVGQSADERQAILARAVQIVMTSGSVVKGAADAAD